MIEPAPESLSRPETPRGRLVAGMAAAVAERGYANATISDVVRHARLSKRTFYEPFPDKETAYLAAYEAAAERLLTAITEAAKGPAPWRERIDAIPRVYLDALAAMPELTRTFLIEILGAGP